MLFDVLMEHCATFRTKRTEAKHDPEMFLVIEAIEYCRNDEDNYVLVNALT